MESLDVGDGDAKLSFEGRRESQAVPGIWRPLHVINGTRLHVNDATMHGLESHQAEPSKPIDRFRFTSIEVQKLQNFFYREQKLLPKHLVRLARV